MAPDGDGLLTQTKNKGTIGPKNKIAGLLTERQGWLDEWKERKRYELGEVFPLEMDAGVLEDINPKCRSGSPTRRVVP